MADYHPLPDTDQTRTDLEHLADLLGQHNAIGHQIAQMIGRPAECRHVGEFLAERIFGVRI